MLVTDVLGEGFRCAECARLPLRTRLPAKAERVLMRSRASNQTGIRIVKDDRVVCSEKEERTMVDGSRERRKVNGT